MRRPARVEAERGSATVEFVALFVGVLVPLLHLLVGLAEVHAAAMSAGAAARHAARTATTGSEDVWRRRAHSAAENALDGRTAQVTVVDGDGDGLLRRGEYVTVTVAARLEPLPPLPWSITVEARGVSRADPCASRPGRKPRLGSGAASHGETGGCPR